MTAGSATLVLIALTAAVIQWPLTSSRLVDRDAPPGTTPSLSASNIQPLPTGLPAADLTAALQDHLARLAPGANLIVLKNPSDGLSFICAGPAVATSDQLQPYLECLFANFQFVDLRLFRNHLQFGLM